MDLLIQLNADATEAEVSEAPAEGPIPPGAHVLRPGETYYGIRYETWRRLVGERVDIRNRAPSLDAEPAPTLAFSKRGALAAAGLAGAGLLTALTSTLWIPFSWGYAVFIFVLAFALIVLPRRLGPAAHAALMGGGLTVGSFIGGWIAYDGWRFSEDAAIRTAAFAQYGGLLAFAYAATILFLYWHAHRYGKRAAGIGVA